MAKCFVCGERKLFTGPANTAGEQALRLTRRLESLYASEELAGAQIDLAERVIRQGNSLIVELESVVHRQVDRFDFQAHSVWVREATTEDIVLTMAIELLRDPSAQFSGEDPKARADEAVLRSRMPVWARMWATMTPGGTDDLGMGVIQLVFEQTGAYPWDEASGFPGFPPVPS